MASVGMQVLFYVTPVIFPAELLTRRAPTCRSSSSLNPMYHLLEVVRRPLLLGGAGRLAQLRRRRPVIVAARRRSRPS